MPSRLKGRDLERFLAGRHVCVLATIGADGSPVLTPIWYLYRDGKLYMRTGAESEEAANLRRDPRVTVCVQDERPPYRSATLYGKATIAPEEPALAARIARHYLGAVAGAEYTRTASRAFEQSATEVTIVVTPERTLTQDFTPETPLYGRLWLVAKRVLPPWL